MNNLFETTSNNATENSRSLAGTAQLNMIASGYATEVMNKLNELDIDYVKAAMHDNNKLDELISSTVSVEVTEVDREFFAALSSTTAEAMLKSQQSKRSRCKSKTMTADNFRSLVQAAISETILRDVYDMAKHSTVGNRRTAVGYTDEELQQLAADQEALARAIRNVQSKKSIMKSKAGFDENSEAWLKLLEVEAQLKSNRVATARTKTVKVDETRAAVTQLFTDVNVDKLNAADAKELLNRILGLTANNAE